MFKVTLAKKLSQMVCLAFLFFVCFGINKQMLAQLYVTQDDVSGDYKEILLAMIGERPPPAPVPEEEDAGEPELEEVEEEHIDVWLCFIFFLQCFEMVECIVP